MDEKLFAIKTAIVAACTALGAFLGWKGLMILAWVVLMALDREMLMMAYPWLI